MSLINGLAAFWSFEESTGPAIDVSGNGHDLTWNVSGRIPPGGAPAVLADPQRTTGVIGYGVDLNGAYLWDTVASWNLLQDTSFTWAGWVNPRGAGTTQYGVVLGVFGNYLLWWDDVADNFEWRVFKQGGGYVSAISTTATRNEWHFVRAWLDLDTSVIGIQVDCGTVVTTAWTGSLNNNTGGQCEFCFGRDSQSYPYSPHYLDAWGLWLRVLSTSEGADLCPGIEFPFGLCGTILYGDYEFAETFHPADDSFEWTPAITKLPRVHGARALDFYAQPRHLLVRGGEIKGPFNQSDLRTRVDAIRNALGAQPQNLQFEPDRYWRDVRVEYFRNPYGPTHYCRIAAEMEISFVARDPFQYALLASTETWLSPTNAATHTVTGGGAADLFSKPSISITVGGAGAVSLDLTLTNSTTNEAFSLAGDVTGGDVIVVDCLNYTVEIGTTDEMALFHGIFPRLDYGDNTWTLTLNSGTLTSIVFEWRNRWW